MTDGQELTALVVASVAGDFFCQVGWGVGSGGGWLGLKEFPGSPFGPNNSWCGVGSGGWLGKV